MKPKLNPILVGIVAGLAAAIVMVASAYSVFLIFVAPILSISMIFIAALGFGNIAGAIAVFTAFFVTGLFASSVIAGVGLAIPLLPALAMSYAANLGRPASEIGGPDGVTAWYPLSDILLIGAICSAILVMLVFLIFAPNFDFLAAAEMAAKMMQEMQPDAIITPESKVLMASTMRKMAPPIYAGMYMLILFASFYAAMRILSALKLGIRPREDIRSSLRMNRLAIVIFVVGIILNFANPTLSTIGGCFLGATTAGFLLAGYALIHDSVRGKPWAIPALFVLYFVTFFFLPLLAFIIAIAGGLANPRRAIALTPNKPNQTPNTPT